jgi:hypothetical protein
MVTLVPYSTKSEHDPTNHERLRIGQIPCERLQAVRKQVEGEEQCIEVLNSPLSTREWIRREAAGTFRGEERV